MLIGASGRGKAKMVVQVTAILVLLLSRPLPVLRLPGLVALGAVVAVTLFSGADYFHRFWRYVMQGGGSGGAPKEPPQVV
jgi:phosphatidylglycerophosphate synthase